MNRGSRALLRGIDALGTLGIDSLGDRGRAAVDLTALVLLVALDLWWLVEHGPRWLLVALHLAALPWVAGIWRRLSSSTTETPPERAPRTGSSARRAWGAVGVATLILAALLLGGAGAAGLLESEVSVANLGKPPRRIPAWLMGKVAACAAQEVLLLCLVFPLSLSLLAGRRRLAMAVSATVFALLHLPNSLLVAVTFVMAATWLPLYRRHRRLVPLITAHVLLAVLLRAALPSHVHLDLNVGSRAVGELREVTWLGEQGLWPRVREYASPAYYQQAGGTDAAFLHALYRDILNRQETPFENRTWQRAMAHHTRLDVVIDFFTSVEYCRRNGLTHPYEKP